MFPFAEFLKSKSRRTNRGTCLLRVCKNPFVVNTSQLLVFPGLVDQDLLVRFPNFILVACATCIGRGRNFS